MASNVWLNFPQDNSSDEKSFLDEVCVSYLNEEGEETVSIIVINFFN
jgi:hypothetical protein